MVTPHAVIIMDGATEAAHCERNGGWLADTLGTKLQQRLTDHPDDDLGTALAAAIETVTRDHRLAPTHAPSTTVSVARWDREFVDVLVLGDSPIIAITRDRHVLQVRDNRLASVAVAERTALRGLDSEAPDADRSAAWARLTEAQRQHRNRPGGYWIAETCPQAAHHAIRARWAIHDLACILAMTDGVANGVDRYRTPPDWLTAADLARTDPSRLIDLVHDTEADDPDRRQWSRSKLHDDKALAVVEFDVR